MSEKNNQKKKKSKRPGIRTRVERFKSGARKVLAIIDLKADNVSIIDKRTGEWIDKSELAQKYRIEICPKLASVETLYMITIETNKLNMEDRQCQE